jgi:hypothetical protein
VHEVGRLRDVAADVAAVHGVQALVVVADRTGVQLHDQPVLDRHPGELHQHVRAELLGVGRRGAAAQTAFVQAGGFGGG